MNPSAAVGAAVVVVMIVVQDAFVFRTTDTTLQVTPNARMLIALGAPKVTYVESTRGPGAWRGASVNRVSPGPFPPPLDEV